MASWLLYRRLFNFRLRDWGAGNLEEALDILYTSIADDEVSLLGESHAFVPGKARNVSNMLGCSKKAECCPCKIQCR
jgi:hypothetical protein